jgi:capsular polysaccharide biosynthesis protein
MIWRWRLRFLVVFGIVALFGCLSLLVLPMQYRAQALVMVGWRETNPLAGQQVVREPREQELDVDGEIQLLTSPPSLTRVVVELKLDDRPEFQSRAGGGILSRLRWVFRRERASATPTEIVVRILQTHLKAERLGRSALISIGYTAGDATVAAEIANAVARNAAVDDAFLSQLTMSERAGFELLKTWIVSPAIAPFEPSSPDIRIIAVATLLVGLGAAFSAVLLREYHASRTILSADQISRRGMRALALIPDVGTKPGRGQSLVKIIADRPNAAFTDSIATLQASLLPLIDQSSHLVWFCFSHRHFRLRGSPPQLQRWERASPPTAGEYYWWTPTCGHQTCIGRSILNVHMEYQTALSRRWS